MIQCDGRTFVLKYYVQRSKIRFSDGGSRKKDQRPGVKYGIWQFRVNYIFFVSLKKKCLRVFFRFKMLNCQHWESLLLLRVSLFNDTITFKVEFATLSSTFTKNINYLRPLTIKEILYSTINNYRLKTKGRI